MRGTLRRAVPSVALLCLLVPTGGCGGADSSSRSQSNKDGDNMACEGQNNHCVNGTLIVSVPPSPSPSPSADALASGESPSPGDSPSGRTRTPSPSDAGEDEEDGDGDGGESGEGSGAAALLERAPRAVLRGPGPGTLRVALLDVTSPQPRWSTQGIGARRLRAAGVDGVLFRLSVPVPATVTVDVSRAPADVEYVFFNADGWRLGTQTAASCAAMCPSLTQNTVAAPQYQHLLVTDAGRSAGWPPGQRYIYTDVT
ncbi:hypothetical protein ABT039_24395 [Streptomyces lasiicapitis]|uniref:hypothetical protein n=1 Tax=Streptomyces lasiicapitis TaxID=1923961 RepID=UPI0033196BDF